MDADRRALERRVAEAPDDESAQGALLVARARAGEPVRQELALRLAALLGGYVEKITNLEGMISPCCRSLCEEVPLQSFRGGMQTVGFLCALAPRTIPGYGRTRGGCGRRLVVVQRERGEPWVARAAVEAAMEIGVRENRTPRITHLPSGAPFESASGNALAALTNARWAGRREYGR